MTDTLEDIAYQEYLGSLHEEYVAALESFTESENLEQLKKSLDQLNKSASEAGAKGNSKLAKELKEVATLNSVFGMLVESEEKGKRRFVIGTALTILGLFFTVIGILLTVRGIRK